MSTGTIPEAGKTICGKGLIPDLEGKCQKYGSIEDGGKTKLGGELLCKSGLYSIKVENGETQYICDRIETDPKCGEDETVTTAGKWVKGGDITVGSGGCQTGTDYNGKDIYYYQYSKLKSKLYEDFLEDYEDIDLEELNTKDQYAYVDDFDEMLKWKTLKKYRLYEYAPALQAAGLIDDDGKVVMIRNVNMNL